MGCALEEKKATSKKDERHSSHLSAVFDTRCHKFSFFKTQALGWVDSCHL